MLKRVALGLALLTTLSGCSLFQAYGQREAIRQAQFHLKSVALDGMDFAGVNVTITLELENPTDIELALDRIDYVLFVNDLRAISGSTPEAVHVPSHDVRPLPIHATLRYRDVSAEVRNLMIRNAGFTYRLEGTGHFDLPLGGSIDYPIQVAPVVSH